MLLYLVLYSAGDGTQDSRMLSKYSTYGTTFPAVFNSSFGRLWDVTALPPRPHRLDGEASCPIIQVEAGGL